MYGKSAKDRMSMFEKKDDKGKNAGTGPKKIGKLNSPFNKDKSEPEKVALKKTPKKTVTKKEPPKKVDKSKPEEKKVEEKKLEDKKPEVKQPEENKDKVMQPEAKATEQTKPAEKKSDESKSEEKIVVVKKPEEKKPEPKKPDEKQPEQKNQEQKKPEQKKPEEKKQEPTKPDAKQQEPKKPEQKKPEQMKPEQKNVEAKKSEEKASVEKKAGEAKSQTKPEPVKKEPLKVEPPKVTEDSKKVVPQKKAEQSELKKPATTIPAKSRPTLAMDDLDLDSELEANLDLMSDIELQSPTSIPAGPVLGEKGKPEPKAGTTKHVPDKPAEGSSVPATKHVEVKPTQQSKPSAPDGKVHIENIPAKDMELKSKPTPSADGGSSGVRVETIPKTDIELKAKSATTANVAAKKPEPAKLEEKKVEPATKTQKTPASAKSDENKDTVKPTFGVEIQEKKPETQPKGEIMAKPQEKKDTSAAKIIPVEVKPQEKKEDSVPQKTSAVAKPQEKKEDISTSQKTSVQVKPQEKKEDISTPQKTPVQAKPQEQKGDISTPQKTPVQAKPEGKKAVVPAPAPRGGQKTVEPEDKEVSAIMDAATQQESVPVQQEVIMKKTFTESIMPQQEFKPLPEEFYNTIFYFSGMGTVVGSALAEGVYVAENTARISLDNEEVQNATKEQQKIEADKDIVIKTARGQAEDIAVELKHLQNLLDSLPTFVDTGVDTQPLVRPSDKPLRGSRVPPPLILGGRVPVQPAPPMVGGGRVPQQPVAEETPPWVKEQPPQQNGIPTWNQQLEDGMAIMGQTPKQDQPGHAGIHGQPFVPQALRGQPTQPAKAVAPVQIVPRAKVEPPQPPKEERLVAPEPVPQQSKPEQKTDTGQEVAEETTHVLPAAPVHAPPPPPTQSALSQLSPKAPPPLTAPSVYKPPGGVSVFPAMGPPLQPSGGLSPGSHRPGAMRGGSASSVHSEDSLGRIAPKQNQPDQGPVRPFGVHTGNVGAPSKPWQDRYGQKSVKDVPQPKPFGRHVDHKGLKTWQLSRLRTLEAQGYEIHQPDDYDTYAHVKNQSQSAEDISSLAPFLVSNKSKHQDFAKLSGQTKGVAYPKLYETARVVPTEHTAVNSGSFKPKVATPTFKPKSNSISAPTYRPVSATNLTRGYHPGANAPFSLPYCDL